MNAIEKYEVVAAAAIKKFRSMILEYKGSPEKLRDYLLNELVNSLYVLRNLFSCL